MQVSGKITERPMAAVRSWTGAGVLERQLFGGPTRAAGLGKAIGSGKTRSRPAADLPPVNVDCRFASVAVGYGAALNSRFCAHCGHSSRRGHMGANDRFQGTADITGPTLDGTIQVTTR
jgi:hypothetical protein